MAVLNFLTTMETAIRRLPQGKTDFEQQVDRLFAAGIPIHTVDAIDSGTNWPKLRSLLKAESAEILSHSYRLRNPTEGLEQMTPGPGVQGLCPGRLDSAQDQESEMRPVQEELPAMSSAERNSCWISRDFLKSSTMCLMLNPSSHC